MANKCVVNIYIPVIYRQRTDEQTQLFEPFPTHPCMAYQTLELKGIENGTHYTEILQNRHLAVRIRQLNSRKPKGS